jgi:hypothetical protein
MKTGQMKTGDTEEFYIIRWNELLSNVNNCLTSYTFVGTDRQLDVKRGRNLRRGKEATDIQTLYTHFQHKLSLPEQDNFTGLVS